MRIAATTFTLVFPLALPLVLAVTPASAQTPAPTAQQPATETATSPSAEKSLWERDTLLGDPSGLRSRLIDHGITFAMTDTEEVFANLGGGLRRGTVYEGLTQVTLKLDSEKFGLWSGGTLVASANQIRGRGPSRDLVGNLQTLSSIEAQPSTKLYDLYYEQSLLGGKLSIRAGQFGADEEFIVSGYAANFVNSSFGFPILPAVDLPNGGPDYPLAIPGVRIKFAPTDTVTLLGAVFNGSPIALGSNPQDNSGTDFRTGDGVFAIAELQYALNQADSDTGLPGTYRFGVWYHSQSFPDLSPRQAVRSYRGNASVYAVVDQLVWRGGNKNADSTDPTKQRGIGVFARVMGAPDDRNTVDFAASAGVVWNGPIDQRQDDRLALGVNYAHLSNHARTADRIAQGQIAGYPIRSSETAIELSYIAQVTGWMQLQPNLQYVTRPGGGVPAPDLPQRLLRDATVLGLRGIVTF